MTTYALRRNTAGMTEAELTKALLESDDVTGLLAQVSYDHDRRIGHMVGVGGGASNTAVFWAPTEYPWDRDNTRATQPAAKPRLIEHRNVSPAHLGVETPTAVEQRYHAAGDGGALASFITLGSTTAGRPQQRRPSGRLLAPTATADDASTDGAYGTWGGSRPRGRRIGGALLPPEDDRATQSSALSDTPPASAAPLSARVAKESLDAQRAAFDALLEEEVRHQEHTLEHARQFREIAEALGYDGDLRIDESVQTGGTPLLPVPIETGPTTGKRPPSVTIAPLPLPLRRSGLVRSPRPSAPAGGSTRPTTPSSVASDFDPQPSSRSLPEPFARTLPGYPADANARRGLMKANQGTAAFKGPTSPPSAKKYGAAAAAAAAQGRSPIAASSAAGSRSATHTSAVSPGKPLNISQVILRKEQKALRHYRELGDISRHTAAAATDHNNTDRHNASLGALTSFEGSTLHRSDTDGALDGGPQQGVYPEPLFLNAPYAYNPHTGQAARANPLRESSPSHHQQAGNGNPHGTTSPPPAKKGASHVAEIKRVPVSSPPDRSPRNMTGTPKNRSLESPPETTLSGRSRRTKGAQPPDALDPKRSFPGTPNTKQQQGSTAWETSPQRRGSNSTSEAGAAGGDGDYFEPSAQKTTQQPVARDNIGDSFEATADVHLHGAGHKRSAPGSPARPTGDLAKEDTDIERHIQESQGGRTATSRGHGRNGTDKKPANSTVKPSPREAGSRRASDASAASGAAIAAAAAAASARQPQPKSSSRRHSHAKSKSDSHEHSKSKREHRVSSPLDPLADTSKPQQPSSLIPTPEASMESPDKARDHFHHHHHHHHATGRISPRHRRPTALEEQDTIVYHPPQPHAATATAPSPRGRYHAASGETDPLRNSHHGGNDDTGSDTGSYSYSYSYSSGYSSDTSYDSYDDNRGGRRGGPAPRGYASYSNGQARGRPNDNSAVVSPLLRRAYTQGGRQQPMIARRRSPPSQQQQYQQQQRQRSNLLLRGSYRTIDGKVVRVTDNAGVEITAGQGQVLPVYPAQRSLSARVAPLYHYDPNAIPSPQRAATYRQGVPIPPRQGSSPGKTPPRVIVMQGGRPPMVPARMPGQPQFGTPQMVARSATAGVLRSGTPGGAAGAALTQRDGFGIPPPMRSHSTPAMGTSPPRGPLTAPPAMPFAAPRSLTPPQDSPQKLHASHVPPVPTHRVASGRLFGGVQPATPQAPANSVDTRFTGSATLPRRPPQLFALQQEVATHTLPAETQTSQSAVFHNRSLSADLARVGRAAAADPKPGGAKRYIPPPPTSRPPALPRNDAEGPMVTITGVSPQSSAPPTLALEAQSRSIPPSIASTPHPPHRASTVVVRVADGSLHRVDAPPLPHTMYPAPQQSAPPHIQVTQRSPSLIMPPPKGMYDGQ
jgi:hypothetical protein